MSDSIPAEIDLDALPGPRRGVHPVVYFRDEIVFSPSGRFFALAYSIAERSFGNEVGMALWGEMDGNKVLRSHPIPSLSVCCWQIPWCRWIDDATFLCKAQRFSRHGTAVPDVLIRAGVDFAVIARDVRSEKWLEAPATEGVTFRPIQGQALAEAIDKTAQQAGAQNP